ncbi:class I SAM-dependent methyltransferase [Chitinibacter tainanensis]|uniref:class I SAM-dependent methyltransferase n=1 Tax=Chitinibacter tainanensis TaxID=230667 RepID=UPI0004287CE9|nr:class I SAM-dependent methyltransferase [Chitinibacter tainanensis]
MKVCLLCKHIFSFDEWTCPSCGHQPKRLNGIEAHAPEFANGGGGFKSEYFSELSRLEAENFWFRARNELILWALKTYKPDARTFLEVGCGTGFVLSGLARACPEMALSGSEIFLAGLSHATKRVPSANFMQMDARRVPFVDEFDVIGAFDVLEHIEEDEVVLSQLNGALKVGGILLLTVPQHTWLWSASDEYACHVRRYGRVEIEKKVVAAGFEILRSSSFVAGLLPAMLLSRWLMGRNAKNFNPADELKINSVLNKSFYGLMMLELAGIKLGINYPVGGSRLIVAKKND